jgi:hypothetical protein
MLTVEGVRRTSKGMMMQSEVRLKGIHDVKISSARKPEPTARGGKMR